MEEESKELIEILQRAREKGGAVPPARVLAELEAELKKVQDRNLTQRVYSDALQRVLKPKPGAGAGATGAGKGAKDEDALTPPDIGEPTDAKKAGLSSGLTGGPLTQAIYDAQSVRTGEGKEGWDLEAAKEAADLYNVGDDAKGWAYADNQGNLQRFPASPLMTHRWLKEHVGTSDAIEEMLDDAVEDEWITKGEKASRTPAVMKKYVKAWAENKPKADRERLKEKARWDRILSRSL